MKKRLVSVLLIVSILCGMFMFGANAAGNPFSDVKRGEYYYDAVLWAVDKGVTTGTSATTFTPAKDCTRAEVVTFLWRAMGKPAPSSTKCAFTDVEKGSWYYDAVLWAAEKGVTTGTSATTFAPTAIVTRSQFVTFLWRAMGKPAASKNTSFGDVSKKNDANSWYYDAVMWAAASGVTTGTGDGNFSPAVNCTRGQTVTFLYRAKGSSSSSKDVGVVYEFSGVGNKTITGINLPKGHYFAEFRVSGTYGDLIRINLVYGSGEYDYDTIVGKFFDRNTSSVQGRNRLWRCQSNAIENGSIEVVAAGAWSIKIKELNKQPSTTTNIRGAGNVVTGLFTATEENNTVKMTYQQTTTEYSVSNFIIWIYNYNGEYYRSHLLANEVCDSWEGEVEVELIPGVQYYFEIDSEGTWTIDFGNGDKLTSYTDMAPYEH